MAKGYATAERENSDDKPNDKHTREGLPIITRKTFESFMTEFEKEIFGPFDINKVADKLGAGLFNSENSIELPKILDYVRDFVLHEWRKEVEQENPVLLSYIDAVTFFYPEKAQGFTKAMFLGMYRLLQDEARRADIHKFLGLEKKAKGDGK
ncbi:MAG: hypothetical protein NTU63_00325 [Candidatus Pacearchaeota archaeon]|nr:hypothetical protein [Candidatus Pacearchaeota archaeon]